MKKTIIIEGMMCSNCEKHVKEALENVDGVIKAKVNWKKGIAKVKVSPFVQIQDLIQAVEQQDYTVISVL